MKSLIFIFLFIASVSHAGVDGGGGSWTEGDLKHFLSRLEVYFKSDEAKATFPEVVNYNKTHPEESFEQILNKLNPRLVNETIYDNYGNERDCFSSKDSVRYFKCNINSLPPKLTENDNNNLKSEYYGSMYRLVLHEAFVQAGLEKPLSKEVSSQYRLTSRLNVHLENFPEWVPGDSHFANCSDGYCKDSLKPWKNAFDNATPLKFSSLPEELLLVNKDYNTSSKNVKDSLLYFKKKGLFWTMASLTEVPGLEWIIIKDGVDTCKRNPDGVISTGGFYPNYSIPCKDVFDANGNPKITLPQLIARKFSGILNPFTQEQGSNDFRTVTKTDSCFSGYGPNGAEYAPCFVRLTVRQNGNDLIAREDHCYCKDTISCIGSNAPYVDFQYFSVNLVTDRLSSQP
jgi:hypothetical protein